MPNLKKLALFLPLAVVAYAIGAPLSVALSAYALAVIADTLAG